MIEEIPLYFIFPEHRGFFAKVRDPRSGWDMFLPNGLGYDGFVDDRASQTNSSTRGMSCLLLRSRHCYWFASRLVIVWTFWLEDTWGDKRFRNLCYMLKKMLCLFSDHQLWSHLRHQWGGVIGSQLLQHGESNFAFFCFLSSSRINEEAWIQAISI